MREQPHPDVAAVTREYVSVLSAAHSHTPLAEVAPDDLADVAAKITETLTLASVRLAEIGA